MFLLSYGRPGDLVHKFVHWWRLASCLIRADQDRAEPARGRGPGRLADWPPPLVKVLVDLPVEGTISISAFYRGTLGTWALGFGRTRDHAQGVLPVRAQTPHTRRAGKHSIGWMAYDLPARMQQLRSQHPCPARGNNTSCQIPER